MSRIDPAIEIVDAQIHEPVPAAPLDPQYAAASTILNVELAREAMDSVGVDAVLAVAPKPFIATAVSRYPDRFAGVVTFNHAAPDLEGQVAAAKAMPGVVAGRALVANWKTAILYPEFDQGVFDPLFATADRLGLPMFCSTHGTAAKMEPLIARHPSLTFIIDHLGVSQHPVSPARDQFWDQLPGLLNLARYPNVHVKLCGAPLLTDMDYPYADIWPYLHQVLRAFGPSRVLWGSDYTRMRQAGPAARPPPPPARPAVQ